MNKDLKEKINCYENMVRQYIDDINETKKLYKNNKITTLQYNEDIKIIKSNIERFIREIDSIIKCEYIKCDKTKQKLNNMIEKVISELNSLNNIIIDYKLSKKTHVIKYKKHSMSILREEQKKRREKAIVIVGMGTITILSVLAFRKMFGTVSSVDKSVINNLNIAMNNIVLIYGFVLVNSITSTTMYSNIKGLVKDNKIKAIKRRYYM